MAVAKNTIKKTQKQIDLEYSLYNCENGRIPAKNCGCRCKGTCHGLMRGSSAEFFGGLPETDPHSLHFIPTIVVKDTPMIINNQLSNVPFVNQKGTLDSLFASLETLPTIEPAESDEQSTVQDIPKAITEFVEMHPRVARLVRGHQYPPNKRQIPILNRVAENKPGSHLIVIAGPGVGKTKTILDAACLIDDSDSIILAYNSKIYKEIDAEVKRLGAAPRVSTMHMLGRAALSKSLGGSNIQLDKKGRKYLDIAKSLLKQNYIQDMSLAAPLKNLTSMAMLCYVEPTEENLRRLVFDYPQKIDLDPQRRWKEWEKVWPLVAEILQEGQRQAHDNGLIVFDDMLYLPVKWSRPDAPEKYKLRLETFRRIVADEAQDFNKVQHMLLLASLDMNGQAMIVGDPKQAIYRFTGALPDGMDYLRKILKAEVFMLDINYRSGKKIIAEYNALFPDQPVFPHENAVDGEVLHLSSSEIVQFFTRPEYTGKTKQCIARTNRDLVAAYRQFISSGVPAHINGKDIGGSLLEAFDKIAKTPGYNKYDLHNFGEILFEYERIQIDGASTSTDAESKIELLRDQVDTLAAVFDAFIDRTPERRNQNEYNFKGYIMEFFGIFTEGEVPIPKKDSIQCITGHGSKGLEAQIVGVIAPEEIPHRAAKTPEDIDSENRVKYVIFSRAKEVMGLLHRDSAFVRSSIIAPPVQQQRSFLDMLGDDEWVSPF